MSSHVAESGLSAPAAPAAQQRELEDHTVLLMLTLSKRGAVRDATVLKGPTTLREAAIEAARKHNYKHQMNVWPFQGQITVGVIFPQDNRSSPEIRQALPAGVPSCVYATAIRVAPEVMQSRLLKRVEPVFPTEVQPVGRIDGLVNNAGRSYAAAIEEIEPTLLFPAMRIRAAADSTQAPA